MTDPIDLAGKSVIVTGEESFDVPHGPEQPGLAQVASSGRAAN
jgi:hypothetical protein